MNKLEQTIADVLIEVINLRSLAELLSKDCEILSESLRKILGDDINAEEIVKELRAKFGTRLYHDILKLSSEIEAEYKYSLTEKQQYYLAAIVFAEEILKRPIPVSLVFRILEYIRVEHEGTFSNRYRPFNQLEKKGLIRRVTLVNSSIRHLYRATEEGRKIASYLDAFNNILNRKNEILNSSKVKKLIEEIQSISHLDESHMILISDGLPKIIENSMILYEDDDIVKILLYGRETAILSLNELKEVDEIATNLKRFTQTDLRSACGSTKKAMAYIVYAYEKGWIRIVDRGGKGNAVIFERN
jgi:DNA-binding MarR family transcriptional regulator